MDKHPHGNCEPCRQQEIKELIGRVNLHVRVGDELLICLDECKVLSQRWQVGSHEKKPAKLPFLGTFLFNTSCKQTAHSLCPRCARLLRRVGGAGCAAHVLPDDSTAALRRGRDQLQRGRAPACYGFFLLIWFPCTKQIPSLCCRSQIRPTCSRISEWGTEGCDDTEKLLLGQVVPALHTACRTWQVCMDTKPPQTLLSSSQTLPSENLLDQSMLFPFCFHFTLRSAEYSLLSF